jgi:polyhydroxyalkanoate synthase
MLGKKPFPFDLLFWNQDSTRMPAANHNFYLREFYHENRLAKGQMTVGGVRLDLKKVKLPTYQLATREDHIAPAKSVYIGARLFGGPVEYVLAGSGHIAGVVNPAGSDKYGYWTSDAAKNPKKPEDWLKSATQHKGSWWPEWKTWIAQFEGEQVPARKPGDGKLKVLENAPGSYVKVKASD